MKKEELALKIKKLLEEELKDTIWYPENFNDIAQCDKDSLCYNPDTLNVEIPIMEKGEPTWLRFVVSVEDVRENLNHK